MAHGEMPFERLSLLAAHQADEVIFANRPAHRNSRLRPCGYYTPFPTSFSGGGPALCGLADRFPVPLTVGHDRPDDARRLVSERDRSDLRRAPCQQCCGRAGDLAVTLSARWPAASLRLEFLADFCGVPADHGGAEAFTPGPCARAEDLPVFARNGALGRVSRLQMVA
jgi:hypothetical protein